MKAMTSLKSLKATDIFLLIQILIFGVTIPTVDTYSDLVLCFNLYTSGHFLWAIATFLPVLICFTFTSVAFHKIPFTSPYHRYIGLPVLLLQVWPQYLCLSIAFEILSGKESWRQRWNNYLRYISTLEPFLESTAQLVIKLCIWTFFKQAHLEREREENPLIDETGEFFFYFSTCVSALASVLGIIRFFKDGPVRFLPQTGAVNGIITLKFLFTFLAVLLSSASKILFLVLMLFYSLGVLPVLLQSPGIGIDLVGTTSEPKCSDLSLVQACGDASFQVKLHSPDPETVIPGDPEWRGRKIRE